MSIKRQVVTLYRNYPLLFFVISVFGGQLLQSYFTYCWGVVALLALLALLFRSKLVLPFNIVLLGALSYLIAVDSADLLSLNNQQSYSAQVIESPRRRRVGEVQLTLEILKIDEEGSDFKLHPSGYKVVCRGKDLSWENEAAIEKGDAVFIKADFKPLQFSYNPFPYDNTLRHRGIKAQCKLRYLSKAIVHKPDSISYLKDKIIASVDNVLGNQEQSGLFLSMSLGERDRLSDITEGAFKESGLAHLLVVSGYQISIIFYSIRQLLQFILIRCGSLYLYCSIGGLATLGGFLAAFLFSLLVGFESSVLRAFSAVLLFVLANHFERASGLLNSLLFSFLILHLFSPLCIFEPGVQLTFAALCGLSLGARGRSGIVAAIMSSTYASIATAIVSYAWFSQFSVIGLILNPLFAGPVSFFSCNLGFLAIVLLSSGLDSEGLLLQFVAEGLSLFKDFVFWCTGYSNA